MKTANYTSPNTYYEKTLATTFKTPYLYYGWTINKLASDIDTTLNFAELELYAEELLNPIYNYVSSNLLSSNLNNYLLLNNSIPANNMQSRLYPPASMTSSPMTYTGYSYGNGVYTAIGNGANTYNIFGVGGWGNYVPFPYSGVNWTYDSNTYNNSTILSGNIYFGDYVQLQIPENIILTSYTIVQQTNVFSGRRPNTFYLAGSLNGNNWNIIDSQFNITSYTGDPPSVSFTLSSNISAYNYYRLLVTQTNGSASLNIQNLYFYGYKPVIIPFVNNLGIGNPIANNQNTFTVNTISYFTSNIGIGTNPSSNDLITLRSSSSNSDADINFINNASSNATIGVGGTNSTSLNSSYSNNFFIHARCNIVINANSNSDSTNPHLFISTNGNIGIGTNNPTAKFQVFNGVANISGSISPNYLNNMKVGSLTIGSINQDYGGGNVAADNTNIAGLLLECGDNTEIAVHDVGHRFASLMYYQGGGANRITIGRNMGYGPLSEIVLNGNISSTGTITSGGNLQESGISLSNKYLQISTFNSNLTLINDTLKANYTPERQYPSKTYDNATTETTITFLGKTVYIQTLTINNYVNGYGIGKYEIYSSSSYGNPIANKEYLFNNNLSDYSVHWATSKMLSLGCARKPIFHVIKILRLWIYPNLGHC